MRCRRGCVSVIVRFGAGDGKLTNLFFNPPLYGELRVWSASENMCLIWTVRMVQMKQPQTSKEAEEHFC